MVLKITVRNFYQYELRSNYESLTILFLFIFLKFYEALVPREVQAQKANKRYFLAKIVREHLIYDI